MNRLMVLGLAATFGAANVAMRTGQGNSPVELQPSSPGVTQSGHLNISGTATVGLLKSQGTVFGQSTASDRLCLRRVLHRGEQPGAGVLRLRFFA